MASPQSSPASPVSTAQAEERAGVRVRVLADNAECVAGAALMADIWGTPADAAPLQSDVLVSIAHAGGCVLGAFSGDELIGLTVGIAGAPHSSDLYSMIAGVAGSAAGRGVGLALKLGQRDWGIERGAVRMKWTYDPLIRRNAHFNLNRLGAHIDEFMPDFYPPMTDAVNAADLTDRVLVVWDFADPRAPVSAPGDAVVVLACGPGDEPVAGPRAPGNWLVATPPDIEAIRRADPARSHRWRLSMREVLRDADHHGLRVLGFTGAGSYLIGRPTP